MKGGELQEYIFKFEGAIAVEEAAQIMYVLLHVISYLHQSNFIHGEVDSEHLLYKKIDDSELKLLISVCSKSSQMGGHMQAIKLCGHRSAPVGRSHQLFYKSPEHFELNPADRSMDVWSAGVILHLLLLGIPPFFDERDSEVINKIKTGWLSSSRNNRHDEPRLGDPLDRSQRPSASNDNQQILENHC